VPETARERAWLGAAIGAGLVVDALAAAAGHSAAVS